MTDAETDDGACVLEEDAGPDARALLVSFAGEGGGYLAMRRFEFTRTAEGFAADKLFLRDPDDLWYLAGVPGVGGDVRTVAAWLVELIARKPGRRVVMVGNSAGGWAALVFGALVGADEIHAFVPKSRVSHVEDFRKAERFHELHERVRAEPAVQDARDLLLASPARPRRIYIHYPRHYPIDVTHAKRLAEVPDVRLVEYRFMYHGLAKALRERGILRPILANALAGNRLGLKLTVARGRLLLRDRHVAERLVRPLWRLVTSGTD